MTILIVEDHELLAQSLAFALREEGWAVHAVAGPTAADVVRAAREVCPDICLLDLGLSEGVGSGLELVAPLREIGMEVVILTGSDDPVRLAECVEAGASGVVPKSVTFEQLVGAIKEAVGGGPLLSPHDREEMLGVLRRQRVAHRERRLPFERLTPRECDVLAALSDGKSADVIAREFYVSLATVRSQIRSILLKLGVNSQLAAVAMARRADWAPVHS